MARPRATRANILGGVLAAALGFALSTQIQHTRAQGLEALSQSDLVGILDTVSQRVTRLDAEAQALQRTRDALASGQSGAQAALTAAQQRLDTLEVLAGAVGATGPGVVVTIADPGRRVDASVLLDAVQELRDAGAESIQIGPVRVVASTAFTDPSAGVVAADSAPLTPPHRLVAIGDPATLAGALAIPGGVVETVRQLGGAVEVRQSDQAQTPALHARQSPGYAQPVPAATSGAG
jgi:uncharacterized protein YlxW (UPF0749 family)